MRRCLTNVLATALILFLISLTTITAHANSYTEVCDVNRDEIVDVSDGVLYCRYVMKDPELAVEKFDFNDCNGDGELSLADVVFILQVISGIESEQVTTTTTTDYENQNEVTTIETHEEETQVTTEETTISVEETKETEVTTYTQTEKKPEDIKNTQDDVLIMQRNEYPIFYGPATQKNVDRHDVVLDTLLFSKKNATYLFGHDTGAFWLLKYINVGETITIRSTDSEKKYKVVMNKIGNMTRDEKDIVFEDGTCIINTEYDQETIILVTCVGGMRTSLRRVVFATIE